MNTFNYTTEILVLGSGTSTGVPSIGCDCETCKSTNPKNKRTRPSVYVTIKSKSYANQFMNILIDASVDLWHQSIAHNLRRIDAVLFTHAHADHMHGIDELRMFNHLQQATIPCFMSEETKKELEIKYSYLFTSPQIGGGVSKITLNVVKPLEKNKIENALGLDFIPLPAMHGPTPVLGYRIGNFAYLTDVTEIPNATIEMLGDLELLIIDCLRYRPHSTHLHVDKAIEYIERIKPKEALFTHMCHDLEYDTLSKQLPNHIKPSYDGLKVIVSNG